MRTIIAGGREFDDSQLLYETLDNLPWVITETVSGRARGADKLGEVYAEDKDIPTSYFPADWDTYGRSAGYRRNEAMAQYAEALVAFWDGKSRGTKHMIDLAKKYNLKVLVISY